MSSLPASEPRRGLLPAAVLLFTLAALCVVRSWLPEDWVVEAWNPGATQFAALYLTLLGVGLVQASDNARRFVWLACVPLLLLAAALVVTGGRGDRLFGLALAALAGGLGGLLFGRRPSTGRVTASLAAGAVGVALVFPMEIALARAPREEARRALAEWTAAEKRSVRDDIGVRLSAPEGWVVLRPASPYVPADPDTVVALLHEKTQARAILRVEPQPQAGTLDEYLDGFAEGWGSREKDLRVEGRGGVALGPVNARRIDVAWTRDGVHYAGRAVAWRDDTRTLVLAAWQEAAAADSTEEIDRLQGALALSLPLSAQVARTIGAASAELPQMTRHAIELLIARRPEADLPALFRDGLAVVSVGFARLGPEQVRDMGEINRVLYGAMPAADGAWMEGYVGRVRGAQPTRPEEDARAMRAMAAAVGRLPEPSRARLRTILEQAVAAAVQG
jgi:hypothetical protein